MFSHDVVPVKEGSSVFEQQSSSVKATSNLKKPTSKQNVNAKSCSRGISLSKNEKHNGPAEQAPKGISFLSHVKVPLGNMSENGQGASSPKADNGAKVDQQRISGPSDLVVSLNKNTLISNLETGKSPLSDPDKREHAGSSLNTDDGVKVGSQIGQGACSISQNMNEPANRTPVMTPRGLNASQRSFLSNTPSSLQKAVRSTLTLAAKFESKNNKDGSYVAPAVSTDLNREASSSKNQSTKAATILDLLFGANSKTK